MQLQDFLTFVVVEFGLQKLQHFTLPLYHLQDISYSSLDNLLSTKGS